MDELVAFTPDMAYLTFTDPSLLVSVVFQNPTGRGVYRERWPLLVGILVTHPSIQAQESEEGMMAGLAGVYAQAIREAADPEAAEIELDKSTPIARLLAEVFPDWTTRSGLPGRVGASLRDAAPFRTFPSVCEHLESWIGNRMGTSRGTGIS